MTLIELKEAGVKYDLEDEPLLLHYAWYVNRLGYVVATDYSEGQQTLVLSRLILNAPRHLQVDHINHNRADNRRINLRLVTHQQNSATRKYVLKSKGIRTTSSGKFQVRIAGKNYGSFSSFEEANLVRQQKLNEYIDQSFISSH